MASTTQRERLPTTSLRSVLPTTPPGSLEVEHGGGDLHLDAMAYGPETLVETRDWSPSATPELPPGATVIWVDGSDVKDPEGLKELGTRFGLHPLALEDVLHQHQRPKLDDYDDTLFLVFNMPFLSEPLGFEQVSLFLGAHFVLTLQEGGGDCFDPVRLRLRSSGGRVRKAGPDYLAYALLDAVIDQYFPIVERYSTRLDRLEKEILDDGRTDRAGELFSVRHDLQTLRRILGSTQSVVASFRNGDFPLVQDGTRLFLRDCLDHTAQLLDAVSSCVELTNSLMDMHLSTLNLRMNEVMKVLTMIATIFIPLSFIAGVYGMNFDPGASPSNMPELRWRYGYPFALGLMALTALAFVVFFWRKGWLWPSLRFPKRRSRRGRRGALR